MFSFTLQYLNLELQREEEQTRSFLCGGLNQQINSCKVAFLSPGLRRVPTITPLPRWLGRAPHAPSVRLPVFVCLNVSAWLRTAFTSHVEHYYTQSVTANGAGPIPDQAADFDGRPKQCI